jgi:hypothetical protein
MNIECALLSKTVFQYTNFVRCLTLLCWSCAQCFQKICRISLFGCLTSEIGKSGIAWKLKSTFKRGRLPVSYELTCKYWTIYFQVYSDAHKHSFRWFSRCFAVETCVIYGCTDHLAYCVGALVLPHLISMVLLRVVWVITHHEISYIAIKLKRKADKEINYGWILAYIQNFRLSVDGSFSCDMDLSYP